ncbi:MAG TPA: hypothetical protein VFL54_03265 [Gammaproteobacteria bacterium]|jgi:hypothetical protein|nr:hypothetical protein [Gammaproteobacteria bacterium]
MKMLITAAFAAAAMLAYGSAFANASDGYVLGRNLFISPGVAQLAKADGKVNLGHDPRITCQPKSGTDNTVTICYTRAEIKAFHRQLINQGRYLPGRDIVASPGVQAIVAREGHVNPYQDSRIRCDVIKAPSSAMPVNYCQTLREAELAHDAALRFVMRSRVLIQKP